PLHYTTREPLVRWTGRVMIQISWLVILLGVPLSLGISPVEALRRALPLPVPWRNIAIASLVMALPFLVMLTIDKLAGWLHFEPKFDAPTRHGKLAVSDTVAARNGRGGGVPRNCSAAIAGSVAAESALYDGCCHGQRNVVFVGAFHPPAAEGETGLATGVRVLSRRLPVWHWLYCWRAQFVGADRAACVGDSDYRDRTALLSVHRPTLDRRLRRISL